MRLTLYHSKKKIFATLKKVAVDLEMDIEMASLKEGRMTLYYSGNFFSFGNKIDVNIKSIAESKSILEVMSRSSAQIQLIDWGTNKDLESNLIKTVKTYLPRRSYMLRIR